MTKQEFRVGFDNFIRDLGVRPRKSTGCISAGYDWNINFKTMEQGNVTAVVEGKDLKVLNSDTPKMYLAFVSGMMNAYITKNAAQTHPNPNPCPFETNIPGIEKIWPKLETVDGDWKDPSEANIQNIVSGEFAVGIIPESKQFNLDRYEIVHGRLVQRMHGLTDDISVKKCRIDNNIVTIDPHGSYYLVGGDYGSKYIMDDDRYWCVLKHKITGKEVWIIKTPSEDEILYVADMEFIREAWALLKNVENNSEEEEE